MKKYLLALLPIVIFIIGLLVAVLLSRQTENVKNKAAGAGGIGSIALAPATVTHYIGEIFPVAVNINTGGASISTVTFEVTYPFTGATPELDVTDQSGNPISALTVNPTLDSNWNFLIKSVTRTNNLVTIDMSGVYVNGANPSVGFTSNSATITTLYFKVNRAVAANPLALSFNSTVSTMQTKSNPHDILNTPTNGSFTIIADTTPANAISDLKTTNLTQTSATLNWTAPTDIGPTAKVASYDVRYSTSLITAANWANATVASGIPVPSNPGTAESLTISGLTAGTTYYFGVKSVDSVGNVSNISNIPSATTLLSCTNNQPTLSLVPQSQTGKQNQALTYQLNIKNNNTGNCPNATFSYSASIGVAAHWTVQLPNPASFTLANGANANANITVTPDNTIANASYPLTVSMTSSQGNSSVTGTYIVNNTLLNYKFKLQGIGQLTNNPPLPYSPFPPSVGVTLTFKTAGSVTTIATFNSPTITPDATGTYSGTQDLGNLAAGTYDVYIKEPNHLQKKSSGVVIVAGANNLDYTATPLIAGDLNNTGSNNNVFDIADIGAILAQYTQLSTPATAANKIYDINGDGVIDISDIGILLSNYTQLEVPGD